MVAFIVRLEAACFARGSVSSPTRSACVTYLVRSSAREGAPTLIAADAKSARPGVETVRLS